MKKKVLSMLLIFCLTFVMLPVPAHAVDTILYVAPAAAGVADGSDWDNPMTISAAWAAATSGTKIYVKGGTYTLASTLTLKDGVSVYGGFAGTEASESERARSDLDSNGITEPWEFTNPSTLTGNIRFFTGNNNVTALVDGFTMISTSNLVSGSVISLYTGNTLQNSIVTGSSSTGKNGVILVDGGALLSSYVHDNITSCERGCVSVYYTYDSPSTVMGCRIEGNQAQYGGGIYSRVPGYQVNIVNNLIKGNKALYRGGGVYMGFGSGSPANARVINNTIMNNIIDAATCIEGGDGDGSGIFAEGGIYAYNNVITGNIGPTGCRQVANSNKGGNFHFKNNAIQDLADIDWTSLGGTVINENNIDLDGTETLFGTGFVPASGSLLTNAGDKTLYPGYVADSSSLKDLKGETRVQGGQIDIGAYEYDSPAADPQVTLTGAIVPYDGTAQTLTATTVPSGLPVTYTYNGSTTPPSDIGLYTVAATVDCTVGDIYYYGTDTATLDIRAVHTITATAGANGSIDPVGPVSVTEGLDQSFTVTPDAGYKIDTLLADGAEVTPTAGVYTFENVTADHTIDASFTRITYALTITAGYGGSITEGASGEYPEGEVIHITATPSSGYSFYNWSATSGIIASSTSAGTTFTMPAGAATLTANFSSNDDGGSGGGGGGGAPATTTYSAGVSGQGAGGTNLPVQVNTGTGSATVSTGGLSDGIFGSEGNTMITVPSISGVNSYTIGITASSLSDPDNEGTLTLKTGNGSITIPGGMLSNMPTEGKTAAVTIGRGDKSGLPGDIQDAIGDRPLISLSLTLGGVQTDWSNPDAPVTVSIPYTPTAAELADPEHIVVWYIDGAGNAVSVPNGHYDPATGTVTFSTTHFSLYAVVFHAVSFADVAQDAWYEKAVGFIAARGITSGIGDGCFSPDAKVTRADFLVMLMRAYGISPDEDPQDSFADAGDTYYTGYLSAAKRLAISGGTGNNRFEPGKQITRQEMFVLLYNALKAIDKLPEGTAGPALSSFADKDEIAAWATEAMTCFTQSGTVGGSGGKLLPLNTTTRAEVAQVLYNLLSK